MLIWLQNVMSATYPELFKAAIVYSGVSAGCFVSSSGAIDAWNSTCANGQSITTPQAWAKVALNMYPGYNGTRPKMQIYHGSADATLKPANYQETTKQWAGVFGYNYDKPESTKQNDPQSQYTRTIWGPNVQGIYATGVGHSVPLRGADDMKFFGFA
jgi:acetylxylan esterase